MFLSILELDQVEKVWPQVADGLDSVRPMWEGMVNKEYILGELRSGKMQLLFAGEKEEIDLVFLTEFRTFPNGNREFHVNLMYGRKLQHYWDFIVDRAERIALFNGCSSWGVSTSRPGLVAMLKEKGFGVRTVDMMKKLPVASSSLN